MDDVIAVSKLIRDAKDSKDIAQHIQKVAELEQSYKDLKKTFNSKEYIADCRGSLKLRVNDKKPEDTAGSFIVFLTGHRG
jgi:hypothetical protein